MRRVLRPTSAERVGTRGPKEVVPFEAQVLAWRGTGLSPMAERVLPAALLQPCRIRVCKPRRGETTVGLGD